MSTAAWKIERPATNGKLGPVIRKKGKTYQDRICYVCGKEHYHRENMCISCRNIEQVGRHGKQYTKRKDMPGEIQRQVELAEHRKRINREMEAIEAEGLSPSNSTIEEIEAAGVELEKFDISGLGKVVFDDER
ncbi:MAG: hypothetical protein FVQ82_06035 [Planctomycetes bacterium]|nr:hypothetical protein [Planctomycetota bacterium]